MTELSIFVDEFGDFERKECVNEDELKKKIAVAPERFINEYYAYFPHSIR